MNKYTIYCTPEQTKKALELGAPILVVPEEFYTEEAHFKMLIEGENASIIIPTAEQMVGWLEEQGFYFRLYTNGCSVEIDYTCILELVNISRKEATLAAIDSALKYLSNKNEIQNIS